MIRRALLLLFLGVGVAVGGDATYEITGNLQLGAFTSNPGEVLTSGHTTVAGDREANLTGGANPGTGHILTVFNSSGSAQTVRAYLYIITDGTSRGFKGTNYNTGTATYTGAQQTISDDSSAFWTSSALSAWHFFTSSFGGGASAAGDADGTIHYRWIVRTSPGGVDVGEPVDFVVNVTDGCTATGGATTVVRNHTPSENAAYPWGGEPESTALFNSTFTVTDYRPGTHTVTLYKGLTGGQGIWGVGGPSAASYTYEGGEFGTAVSILQFETWTEGAIGDTYSYSLDGVNQGGFVVNPNEGGIGPEGAFSTPDMYTVSAGNKFPGDDEDDEDYEGPEADPDDLPAEIPAPVDDPEIYDPDTDPNPAGDDLTKKDFKEAVQSAVNVGGGGIFPTAIPGTTVGEYLQGQGDAENPYLEGSDGAQGKLGAATGAVGDGTAQFASGLEGFGLPGGLPSGSLGTNLQWNLAFPVFGAQTIDLSGYTSHINIFRNLLLLVACVTFWFLFVKILRGHSAN